MNLTVLGSGTTSPHKSRASSGYWLETSGGSIMLDLSATAFHNAARFGLDWANLDAIWISHFHLDHVGGLAPFLFGTKYAFETYLRRKPLRIFAPAGLIKLLETFDSAYDYGVLSSRFRSKSSKSRLASNSRFCRILSPTLFQLRTRRKASRLV